MPSAHAHAHRQPSPGSTANVPTLPSLLPGFSRVDEGLLGLAALIGAAVCAHNGALGVVAVVPFLLCVVTAWRIFLQQRGAGSAAEASQSLEKKRLAVGIFRLCGSFRALLLFLAVCGFVRAPGADFSLTNERWPFVLMAFLLVEVGARAVSARSGLRTALFVAVVYFLVGEYVIVCTPSPHIDLYIAQRQGAAMLVAGQNPYAGLFDNPYSAAESLEYLGEATPFLTHYPYPPLSLLVSTVSQAVFGELRVLYLLLHVAVGLCLNALGNRRRAGLGVALLCVYFLFPRGFLVVEQSWTEPLIAASVAVYALLRERRCGEPAKEPGSWLAEALSFSALLSAKQYSVLFLPIVAMALPREKNRAKILSTATVLAGLLLLPFFLWGPADFLDDVLRFQLRQPFRSDALSLPALLAFVTGWKAPGVLSFVAAAAVFLGLRERGDASTRGMLIHAALVYFAFFGFAKQAFCNYYYFVWVLLLLAIASGSDEATRSSAPRSRS